VTNLWVAGGTSLIEQPNVIDKRDPYALLRWLNTAPWNLGQAQLWGVADSKHVNRAIFDAPVQPRKPLLLFFPTTTATFPPSDVAGFSGTATSENQINLNWTAAITTSPFAITQYNVYRNGVLIGSPTGTSFSDTGLTAWTNYTYQIEAVDNQPLVSLNQASVTVRTLDITAPSAVVIFLTATTNAVNASWTAATDAGSGISGYQVYLGAVLIATQAGTTYGFTGLLPGTLYTVTVVTSDVAGNSSTAIASITTIVGAIYALPEDRTVILGPINRTVH
jgi:hypothetical protein